MAIAPQDNVTTTASIPAIGTTECRKFVPHEMAAAGPTMAAAAENTDLVDKIAFFQLVCFLRRCKYTAAIS